MNYSDLTNVGIEKTVVDPPKPELGELLVWNSVNAPSEMYFYYVDSVEQAKGVINYIANVQLSNRHIISNAFGLMMVGEDEENSLEWVEWSDEEGDDISEVMKMGAV
jgi:hypothetical protein